MWIGPDQPDKREPVRFHPALDLCRQADLIVRPQVVLFNKSGGVGHGKLLWVPRAAVADDIPFSPNIISRG